MRQDELVWQALSDPTRRKILDVLRGGPRTTGNLCTRFPQSRTAVMKHLDLLEEARLLTIRRLGRERWNYINVAPIRRIYERWLNPFQQLWASSLAELATVAEGPNAVQNTEIALSNASIVHETTIAAPPDRVFDALTNEIARWWSHVSYENAERPDLRFEARAGGRFYEVHGKNERLYAVVTRCEPPARLWMQGAMGMSGCVFGTIVYELEPSGAGGTLLKLTHDVIGHVDGETVAMYRSGWASLLDERFKAFVESGTEAWPAA